MKRCDWANANLSEYHDEEWGVPVHGKRETIKDVPAKTAESCAIVKDLKKRGMSFVGPTIIYAYMQAVGMVNDHLVSCFRYSEVRELQ